MGRVRALGQIALAHPQEVWDRVRIAVRARVDRRRDRPGEYTLTMPTETYEALRSVGYDVTAHLNEVALEQIALHVQAPNKVAPFHQKHNADPKLGRLLYGLTRAVKPQIVVETGVAHGVSTAFILQALRENGAGRLHSIDLPPLAVDADRFVGTLVPEDIRDRWTLHRGSVQRLLPRVLRSVGHVGLFVHDSLHTYAHMMWELQSVTPFLEAGAAVVMDDVHRNAAFGDWVGTIQPRLSLVMYEPAKDRLAGLAVLN